MNRLSVFTRHPKAGDVKTRLIPALGAQKAMDIHCLLTEMTLKTAAALTKKFKADIEIAYHGGSLSKMKSWLGKSYHFSRQVDGDLGLKMQAVFETNFNSGIKKNIVIGSDCPQLSADILAGAFGELDAHDLVLGPAADGGYYAIGMKEPYPRLFQNIAWGSDKAFDQTLSIAEELELRVFLPPTLSDVDRPEDMSLLRI